MCTVSNVVFEMILTKAIFHNGHYEKFSILGIPMNIITSQEQKSYIVISY